MNDVLRFPIGQYEAPTKITPEQRAAWIDDLAAQPFDLERLVRALPEADLNKPYRPEGWTIRQVVHHLPDSHLNAYIRYKLSLTLDNPSILPYPEKAWAELPDGKEGPIDDSLQLFKSVHARWVRCLQHMTESDWKRTYFHPEHQRTFVLDETLGSYVWHGRHHLAHIENALNDE